MYSREILSFLERHHFSRVVPKAALIDMDGTLFDSMPNHAKAWYRMVSELGIDCTQEEFFGYEGMTGAATINLLFNRAYGRDAKQEEIERYYHLKTEYFRELPQPEVMPGAAEMLNFFKSVGVKTVLVTGSGQNSLLGRLEKEFPGIFPSDMRVTARDVKHGKPHPEPFIRAMQIAGVSPSGSIAIDNAPLGVQSASASGAFTIGVVTGPISQKSLFDAGANIVFPSMKACASALPALMYQFLTTSIDR